MHLLSLNAEFEKKGGGFGEMLASVPEAEQGGVLVAGATKLEGEGGDGAKLAGTGCGVMQIGGEDGLEAIHRLGIATLAKQQVTEGVVCGGVVGAEIERRREEPVRGSGVALMHLGKRLRGKKAWIVKRLRILGSGGEEKDDREEGWRGHVGTRSVRAHPEISPTSRFLLRRADGGRCETEIGRRIDLAVGALLPWSMLVAD